MWPDRQAPRLYACPCVVGLFERRRDVQLDVATVLVPRDVCIACLHHVGHDSLNALSTVLITVLRDLGGLGVVAVERVVIILDQLLIQGDVSNNCSTKHGDLVIVVTRLCLHC